MRLEEAREPGRLSKRTIERIKEIIFEDLLGQDSPSTDYILSRWNDAMLLILNARNILGLNSYISTDSTFTNASLAAWNELRAFPLEITRRDDIFKVIQTLVPFEDEKDPKKIKYIKDIIKDFDKTKTDEKLEQINITHDRISSEIFDEINHDDRVLILSPKELAGCQSSLFEQSESGDFAIPYFQVNHVNHILCNALDLDVKHRATLAKFPSFERNRDRMTLLAQNRHQLALLHEKQNYAEFYYETNTIAKTPGRILEFLDEIAPTIKLKAAQAIEQTTGLSGKVAHHEYLNAKYSKNDSQIEAICRFYTLGPTVAKSLLLFKELFDVEIIEFSDHWLGIWHPSVKHFIVFDATSKKEIGEFYLDLLDRPGKPYDRNGSVCLVRDNVIGQQTAMLVMRFSFSGAWDTCALTSDCLTALFHEFGHIFQHLFAKNKYPNENSSRIPQDFIEVPAIVFEHLSRDSCVLRRLSEHHQTKNPIPYNLIDQILMLNENQNIQRCENLAYAYADLAINTASFDSSCDNRQIFDLFNDTLRHHTCLTYPSECCFLSKFHYYLRSHPYYQYLWSEVIACDIVSQFGDLLNPKEWQRYRRIILENSIFDPMSSVTEFLGRPFNNKAFFKTL